MAISTYAQLQASAANWLIRGDLTARIPEFITLAEARLNRQLRKRQAEIDADLVGVVGSRFIPLPAAFDEGLNLWHVDGAGRSPVSRFIDPALIRTSTAAGRPNHWTIDGANVAFNRPCDQAYSFTLRMLAKYALSDASPTNDLLTDYPDAYLFATLCEAGPFLRDQDVTAVYEQKATRAIDEINSKEARSRSMQTLSTEPGQLLGAGRRYGIGVSGVVGSGGGGGEFDWSEGDNTDLLGV